MDIDKVIKKIRQLKEEMASGGIPANNASSGNICLLYTSDAADED